MRNEADLDRRRSFNVRLMKLSEGLKTRKNVLGVFMLSCLTSEAITTFMDMSIDYNDGFVLGKVAYHCRNVVRLIENQSRKVYITTTAASSMMICIQQM